MKETGDKIYGKITNDLRRGRSDWGQKQKDIQQRKKEGTKRGREGRPWNERRRGRGLRDLPSLIVPSLKRKD